MNEDFSLGKMSADARLTATFKYYEKTEQNGEIIITACLGKGDVPKLNRGYGLDGNELWLSLNNLYQSIRGKDDYTAADDIISWCQQYAHPYYASEDIEEYRWDIEKDTEYWDFSTNILGNFTFTNEGFNSIGLNKNIYLSLIDVTTPVEEVISTKSPAPTNAVRDAIEKGTTPSKLGKVLNANSSYNEVLKSLEDAGLKINSTIESNDRRLASIPVGDNTLTLTNKWLELDSNQQVLKVIHEGIHYYFAKEGIDTTKFNDLYNKFKEFINSPEVNDVVKNTYSKYLNETKEYNVAVEEFVVEAITSREFARLLSSIPYASTTVSDSNNIFTNIIDALLELIGNVSGIDNTILGEIRNRLSKISEINTGEESTNEVIDNNDEIYSEPIAEIEDAFMSDFDGIADIEFDSSIIDSNANLTPTISSLFSRLNYQQQRSLDSLQARDEVNYTCS